MKDEATILLILLMLAAALMAGGLRAAWAQGENADGEEGNSVRLIVTIAAIWLAIMAAVVTVVVLTRRKSGEEERKSKEE